MARLKAEPIDYFRRFYADTAMFGASHAVRCAVEFFGTDHMLFGTDMPLGGPTVVADTIADIEALGLPDADTEAIFAGNARRLPGSRSGPHGPVTAHHALSLGKEEGMAGSEQGYERLGAKLLSLPDVIAQSVGFMGPVFSSAFVIPLVVGVISASGKGGGVAAPLSVLLAAIGVFALGWVVSSYAKEIHAAGSLYDYVTRGLGERVGTRPAGSTTAG